MSELPGPLRVAYLVARFPKTTETFVVRELNRVSEQPGFDVRLLALFRPLLGSSLVHPSAAAWVDRVSRPSWRSVVRASGYWLRHRPVTVLTTTLLLVWGFRRKPGLLIRALASMVIAFAHAKELASDHVEHVHAHFLGNTATAAWVIRRLTGIPYSVTAHAYDLFVDQDFLTRRVRDAEFVVAISRFNADFIVRNCRGRLPPIVLIHAGIDLGAFPFIARARLAGEQVSSLAVGSLLPRKGHRVLVEALAGEDPVLRRVHLTIVGEGEQRHVLEALIRDLQLGDRVTLAGAQSEDRVAELLQEADLFILPSKVDENGGMEGIPVVLMEALASGVPTIATRLSGIPELIEEGVTGALADPDDVESLRSAIRRTLTDPGRARRVALSGRARVEADYDVESCAARLADHILQAHHRGVVEVGGS